MTQRRGTTTDRLSNVIQVLQLGRKSGILMVERGEGAALEYGEVTFVQGHVTNAQCGRLVGQRAVDVLLTWGLCRFVFIPLVSERATRPMPALPPAGGAARDTDPYLHIHAQTVPQRNLGAPQANRMARAPQRTQPIEAALQIIEQNGLTRSHRRLFLLVDGQRSTAEMARLVGRSVEEVQFMLKEMERIGVLLS